MLLLGNVSHLFRLFEWGFLDNTKHLNLWLNVRHFNTSCEKFPVAVNFIQMETKTAPKIATLLCSVYQEVFGHFPTIADLFGRFRKITEDSRRFLKTTEDVQRLPKMSEDYRSFPRRIPKIFDYIFVVIFTCLSYVKDVFLQC